MLAVASFSPDPYVTWTFKVGGTRSSATTGTTSTLSNRHC